MRIHRSSACRLAICHFNAFIRYGTGELSHVLTFYSEPERKCLILRTKYIMFIENISVDRRAGKYLHLYFIALKAIPRISLSVSSTRGPVGSQSNEIHFDQRAARSQVVPFCFIALRLRERSFSRGLPGVGCVRTRVKLGAKEAKEALPKYQSCPTYLATPAKEGRAFFRSLFFLLFFLSRCCARVKKRRDGRISERRAWREIESHSSRIAG